MRLCIINGYPRATRDVLAQAGACGADELFVRVFGRLAPHMVFETLYLADLDAPVPDRRWIDGFDGFVWTGSNLTAYEDDPRVTRQIEFARHLFETGRPTFGSCWGAQIAVMAAGGEVGKSGRGREIGIGRKVRLTPAGRRHPMYDGKPDVFDVFASHLDEVTRLPAGAAVLAANEHSEVQALEITHKNGVFWGTQYHPEFDLYHVARLMASRVDALVREGFFADGTAALASIDQIDSLARAPGRKDLRWALGMDDDVLDESVRCRELRNWLECQVVPSIRGRPGPASPARVGRPARAGSARSGSPRAGRTPPYRSAH